MNIRKTKEQHRKVKLARIVAVFLCIYQCLPAAELPVYAKEAESIAYTGQTEVGDYTISTAAQLAELANVVDSGKHDLPRKYVSAEY